LEATDPERERMTIGIRRSSVLLMHVHLVLCHGTSRTLRAVIISFLCLRDTNGRTSVRDTSIGWDGGAGGVDIGACTVLSLFKRNSLRSTGISPSQVLGVEQLICF